MPRALALALTILGSAWPIATHASAQVAAPGDGQDPVPRTLLSVPYLPQEEDLCGGAAAAMVRRYWGDHDAAPDEYRELIDRTAGGIHTVALVDALRAGGWQTLPSTGSIAMLASEVDAGRPVVALLEVAPARYHYVVVIGVGPDHIVFHDPADAPFRVAERTEFERLWAPTERWAVRVAPSAPGPSSARTGNLPPSAVAGAGGPRQEPPALSGPEARAEPAGPLAPPVPCETIVGRGQSFAAAGRLHAASTELERAIERCPDSALAHRELAGIRFREDRWSQAADLAGTAVHLDPNDGLAWRLRGTSLYLDDRREEALAAWNEVGEPTVDLIRAPGLDDVRFDVVRAAVGLKRGDRLTPRRLRLAQRRVDELPAAARANVRYEPTGRGRVDLEIGLLERRSSGFDIPSAARAAIDAATERRLTAVFVPPGGRGELLTLRWRWQTGRPQMLLRGEAPRAFGLPGVLSVEGAWQAEDHRADRTGPDRETLRRGGIGWSDWVAPATRVDLGVAVNRWSERGTDLSVSLGLQQRMLAEHAAVRATASHNVSLDRRGPFLTWALQGLWRSTTVGDRPLAEARVGLHEVGGRAPRTVWPGAGTGLGRAALLRAHPVFEDGAVQPSGIGRLMVHGSVEARALPWRLTPVAIGPAVFVDWAYLARQPSDLEERFRADAGVGLRAAMAGVPGHLRLDVATGLADDAFAVSLGWRAAWPDW